MSRGGGATIVAPVLPFLPATGLVLASKVFDLIVIPSAAKGEVEGSRGETSKLPLRSSGRALRLPPRDPSTSLRMTSHG
jgi:hypothetical protein